MEVVSQEVSYDGKENILALNIKNILGFKSTDGDGKQNPDNAINPERKSRT